MPPCRDLVQSRKGRGAIAGFTLTELLIVIAVVLILCALLVPALSRGRFNSRVILCVNHYRQWGIAAGAYAADDGRGRLPSFRLPVDKLGFIDPWIVAQEMVTNVAGYGVTTPMWFCPTRPGQLEYRRDNFRLLRSRELLTPADLVDETIHVQKAAYFWGDLMWWVPRPLGEALEFPDPVQMKVRTPDPWPGRLADPTISTQPMISDSLSAEWNAEDQTVHIPNNAGGHQWAGSLSSLNVGFADGHVETRPKSKLQWQARRPGGFVYVY